MRIKRSGWLCRWAYLLSEHGAPHNVDVCTLFWRCVLFTPLKIVMVSLLAMAIIVLFVWVVFVLPGLLFYQGFVIFGALWVAIESLLAVWIVDEFRKANLPGRESTITNVFQLAGKFIVAKKTPFCPLVSIDD